MRIVEIEELGFAVIPPSLLVGSTLLALWWAPGEKLRSALLHFAAGVVFAVVAVEMIPDVMNEHSLAETVTGFVVGVALMLTVKAFAGHRDRDDGGEPAPGLPRALLLAVGVDLFIDGLVLGIGFTVSLKQGRLIALALAMELVTLGLATTSTLRKNGTSRSRSLVVGAALAFIFIAATGLGVTVLAAAPHVVIGVLIPFGVAALLFLVTEELLIEAHEGPEMPWMTAAFFAGFLLFLVLGELS